MRHSVLIVLFAALSLSGCTLLSRESQNRIDQYSGDIQTNITVSHDYFEKLCLEDLEAQADKKFGAIRDQYIDGLIEYKEGEAFTIANVLASGQKFIEERERVRSELLARAAQHTKYLTGLKVSAKAIGVYNQLMTEIDRMEREILADVYNTDLAAMFASIGSQGSVNDDMEAVIYQAARELLNFLPEGPAE